MLFTSLMLILLTFFIVLSTFGVQDQRKQRLAFNSLLGSFGILPGGQSPYNGEKKINMPGKSSPVTPGTVDLKQIRTALQNTVSISGFGVSEGKLGATITLKSNVLFEQETDIFKAEAYEVLDQLVSIFNRIDNHIIIAGHTDSIPVEEPPFFSNWALSAARALVVLDYFRAKGISDERMVAYGLSSHQPISSNSTEYGRRLNRRVEIAVIGDLPGDTPHNKILTEQPSEPIETFQYKGFKFRMDEQ